jgi:hypothetical protein
MSNFKKILREIKGYDKWATSGPPGEKIYEEDATEELWNAVWTGIEKSSKLKKYFDEVKIIDTSFGDEIIVKLINHQEEPTGDGNKTTKYDDVLMYKVQIKLVD